MGTLESKYDNIDYSYPIYPSFFLVKEKYGLGTKRVLDLGASDGRYLAHFGPDSKGVEYGPVDREKANKRGFDVAFGNLNKEFGFFKDEAFDYIFCSHVIEHLESPYLFLKKVRAFGGENAKLILGYPIEHSLVRFFDRYFIGHKDHIYSFSLENIEALFRETGMEIERIFFDIPLAGRWPAFKWLQKIVQPLPYWAVSWWSNAVYIVAKKI